MPAVEGLSFLYIVVDDEEEEEEEEEGNAADDDEEHCIDRSIICNFSIDILSDNRVIILLFH